MSRAHRIATLALCLVAGMIWIAAGPSGRAADPPATPSVEPLRGDVIMMRCATDDARFAVTAFRGSSQAPGKKADICAEELSLLLRDGFAIRNVGHSDVDKKYVVFTLAR